jgi:hypothetical protein
MLLGLEHPLLRSTDRANLKSAIRHRLLGGQHIHRIIYEDDTD